MSLLKPFGISLALASLAAAPAMAQPGYPHHRGGGGAIIFQDDDYRGRSLRIDGPIDDLGRYNFNDRISSIEVRGTWELCVHADFRGRCEIVHGPERNLRRLSLNDTVSSLRPVNSHYGRGGRDDWGYGRGPGRGAAPIMLYQDDDFRGNALPVSGAITNLHDYRFNDAVSSIAVQHGAWEVCTDANFRGRCQIVSASSARLRNYNLNDSISSVRPAGRGYGYDRNYRRRW